MVLANILNVTHEFMIKPNPGFHNTIVPYKVEYYVILLVNLLLTFSYLHVKFIEHSMHSVNCYWRLVQKVLIIVGIIMLKINSNFCCDTY